MFTVGLYLLVFVITILLSYVFTNNSYSLFIKPISLCLKGYGYNKTISLSKYNNKSNFLGFLLAFVPLMFIYTVRYGIGEDYFPYEQIYNTMRESSLSIYLEYHALSIGHFYIEPLYYIINKISPSYIFLQFIIVFLMSVNIAATENEYPESKGFIVYIFLCCHFIYSMNGTRFILGLSYIMLAIAKLLKNKNIQFIVLVAISSLFHKTFIVVFLFLLLKGYKTDKSNKSINFIVFFASIFSPVILPVLLNIASGISFLSRYFTVSDYAINETVEVSSLWIMHILPVAISLIFVPREVFYKDKEFSTILRIYMLEVPFRFLAFYNIWFGRMARVPQVIEVFLIPYILSKQKINSNKVILTIYYIVWYAFYFAYYYLIDGAYSYQWIFNRSI